MEVVQLITDSMGDETNDTSWHYIQDWSDGDRVLCSGDVFGAGESSADYETKNGKITCLKCIKIIKQIKAIKL